MTIPIAPDDPQALSGLLPATSATFRPLVERAAVGLAFSALFGAAAAARYGVLAMLVHAAGVPLGLGLAVGLSTPALCIAVLHFDLPLDTQGVLAAVCRGLFVAGFTLAGLAPALLLLTVTVEQPSSAAVLTALGLGLGGALGLRAVAAGFGPRGRALFWGFLLFVVLLTVRVWWQTLPMLGGGQ